jgi:hypothetical protein
MPIAFLRKERNDYLVRQYSKSPLTGIGGISAIRGLRS